MADGRLEASIFAPHSTSSFYGEEAYEIDMTSSCFLDRECGIKNETVSLNYNVRTYYTPSI